MTNTYTISGMSCNGCRTKAEKALNEIAIQLNYSNVAHLINQFKKVTDFTPTHFKKLKDKKRKQIDNL